MACGDEEVTPEDTFDRSSMLTHWADNIIIPAYEDYANTLTAMQGANTSFANNPSVQTLNELRSSWLEAYHAWQWVSMFEIGKAEEIGLRNFTNIFPADITMIESHIETGNYNLQLPSNFDTQGFPALDYVLFGIAETDEEIITRLTDGKTDVFVNDLISRLNELTQEVLLDWKSGYRENFISNSGSSGTASVDKTVNDFIFHYEKFFRAGKVGIPAGVFSGNTNSLSVEAPYSSVYSKSLFFEAFTAIQHFFLGKNKTGDLDGESLYEYIKSSSQQFSTEDISENILDQWMVAENTANELNESFKDQVEQDNIKMLETYDELQRVVAMLKVDMLQSLSIQVDFIDADGD